MRVTLGLKELVPVQFGRQSELPGVGLAWLTLTTSRFPPWSLRMKDDMVGKFEVWTRGSGLGLIVLIRQK
jgi:hypothetical protein